MELSNYKVKNLRSLRSLGRVFDAPVLKALCVLEYQMEINTKPKLIRYIEENQISGVLNNTKWDRLFEALKEIEGMLDFQRKDLDETEPDPNYWDGDLYHVMGGVEQIEYLTIRALVSERRGALLKPKVTDNTNLLIQALEKAGTPYEKHKEGVRVWGYLRPGVSPKWVNT